MKHFCWIFLVLTFFTSCTYNSGLVNQFSTYGTNTNVVLQEKNFKVVGMVSGTASADYFLGFVGGLGIGGKMRLIEEAKKDMYAKANLEGTSRAIINSGLEEDLAWYVFVWKKTITVHGTIIEFEK